MGSGLIAFSHEDNFQVVEQSNENIFEDRLNLNSFVAAIHQAFAEHRPLLITPDAVWMTILKDLLNISIIIQNGYAINSLIIRVRKN
ncbi:MAG: DUF4419 domain-containing protein [Cyanobacteria bacterium J06643_5]